MSPATAREIAIELRKRLPGLHTKKLHKLLYYCQGHHLANFGAPLFVEPISAWDMGPVVGGLWRAEKEGMTSPAEQLHDEAVLNTVGYVISRYGALSGSDLERLAHSEDPWLRANEGRPDNGSVKIQTEWIQEFFSQADSSDDDSGAEPDSDTISAWLLKSSPNRPTITIDTVEGIRARSRSNGHYN